MAGAGSGDGAGDVRGEGDLRRGHEQHLRAPWGRQQRHEGLQLQRERQVSPPPLHEAGGAAECEGAHQAVSLDSIIDAKHR